MSATRVFLLASALARLIERERRGHLVRQGFFPDRTGRSAHVQVAGETGHLILISHQAAGPREEPAEISRVQAEALLELTAGQTQYLSIPIEVGSHSATIQRFVTPAPLDLISITFKQDKTARKFQPPAWFGPEVTSEATYQVRSLALAGLPSAPELEVTNEALHSLLDVLDNRAGEPQPQPTEVSRVPQTLEGSIGICGATMSPTVSYDRRSGSTADFWGALSQSAP
jgi:CYTH domain-containing protein